MQVRFNMEVNKKKKKLHKKKKEKETDSHIISLLFKFQRVDFLVSFRPLVDFYLFRLRVRFNQNSKGF